VHRTVATPYGTCALGQRGDRLPCVVLAHRVIEGGAQGLEMATGFLLGPGFPTHEW